MECTNGKQIMKNDDTFTINIMLYTKMNYIKYQNSTKLHISKSPPLFSWILAIGLILSTFLLVILNFLNYLSKGILVFLFILIGFYILYWEDVVLDKQYENVIITKSNWLQRVLCRIPATNSIIFPISDIVEVSISKLNGVRFKFRNRKSIPIIENSTGSYKQLKELQRTISTFLRLERIEECHRNCLWDFTDEYLSWYTNEETNNDESEPEPEEEFSRFGCRDAIKVITPSDRRRRESS